MRSSTRICAPICSAEGPIREVKPKAAAAPAPGAARQPVDRQPARAESDEPSVPRTRADHRGRLAGDREGGAAHAEDDAGGAPLVDFNGPLGWDASAVGIGRAADPPRPRHTAGVQARLREVLPLVELRVSFEHARAPNSTRIDRGATDPDLDPVIDGGARDRHRRGPRGLPRLCGGEHHAASARRAGVAVPIGGATPTIRSLVATRADQAARRRRRRSVRRGAERAALHGSDRRAPMRAIRMLQPRPAADRRRRRLGARARWRPW